MTIVSSTAWRYVDVSAIAVTGHARPAASSSGASALRAARVFRSFSRRLCGGHALGELKQIEGFAPNAEVEVDEHDRDLEHRNRERADEHCNRLRYRQRDVLGYDNAQQATGQ